MGLIAYFDRLINERGSSSILRDRLVLMEEKHATEKQKLKTDHDELEEKIRAVTSVRDFAHSELRHAKNELEQANVRISQMEPLAIRAREMAIAVSFRKALTGSGHVLTIHNKTTKPLGLSLKVSDAVRQKTKEYRIVVDGGTAVGANFQAANPKEIGHAEGWAFASGDIAEIACQGYDPMQVRIALNPFRKGFSPDYLQGTADGLRGWHGDSHGLNTAVRFIMG
jgi:hypothetical protein